MSVLRLLAPLFLALCVASPLLLPSHALGAEDEEEEQTKSDKSDEKDYDEMTPMEVRLQAVRLRKKIAKLDRTDTAAAYGFALRRESRYFIGGGLGLVGLTMASSGIALAVAPNDKLVPLMASIGIPVGLGIVVAGLPAMILAPRLLGWYAKNGPAPSHLARLKLQNRWRMEELRVRRDTSLIATAFFGAATGLTMAVWGGRDRAGANGVVGSNYDPGDAVIALSFLTVTSATGVMGLLWALQHRDARMNKHRLFVMPTVAMGPETAHRTAAQRIDGVAPSTGMAVRGALTFTF